MEYSVIVKFIVAFHGFNTEAVRRRRVARCWFHYITQLDYATTYCSKLWRELIGGGGRISQAPDDELEMSCKILLSESRSDGCQMQELRRSIGLESRVQSASPALI